MLPMVMMMMVMVILVFLVVKGRGFIVSLRRIIATGF
jgi:hypothetical protein